MTTDKTTADALDDPATSRRALAAGHRELMARADRISNLERRKLLENVPEHWAIVEMWERLM